VRIVQGNTAGLDEAVAALQAGEVIAYPTETVYGLGADPFSEPAVRRLFEVKQRDARNPILVVIAGLEQLEEVAGNVSPAARAYAKAFWPGPVSLVLPKGPRLPDVLTAGSDTVCVRCPGSPIARKICRRFAHAITSTSANRSGEEPARSLKEIALPGITLGIDGGVLTTTGVSTVFDPDRREVLRQGVVPESALVGFSW